MDVRADIARRFDPPLNNLPIPKAMSGSKKYVPVHREEKIPSSESVKVGADREIEQKRRNRDPVENLVRFPEGLRRKLRRSYRAISQGESLLQ